MITEGDAPRDLSWLAVPPRGSLDATGDLFEPYRLVDAHGVVVVAAAAYFRELAACGRQAATHRSYGMAMLRWWRRSCSWTWMEVMMSVSGFVVVVVGVGGWMGGWVGGSSGDGWEVGGWWMDG